MMEETKMQVEVECTVLDKNALEYEKVSRILIHPCNVIQPLDRF